MADPFDYKNGFIYVDLDGCLAEHGSVAEKDWKGFEYIGMPIEPMVARVKQFLEDGYKVKIFTARAYSHGKFVDGEHPYHIDAIGPIERWCKVIFGQVLEVTCVKAPDCVAMLDDRAFHVPCNTGTVIPDMPEQKE